MTVTRACPATGRLRLRFPTIRMTTTLRRPAPGPPREPAGSGRPARDRQGHAARPSSTPRPTPTASSPPSGSTARSPTRRRRPSASTGASPTCSRARPSGPRSTGRSSWASSGPAGSTGARWASARADDRRPAGRARARRQPRALRAYGGAEFADQALALRDYNRAVGLRALVVGLEAAKPRLQHRLLRDKSVTVYPGGRLDLALGRVDVRVIVLLRYLRQAHKQVTVSSLISGHRLYSRPGVISAHIYGLAVDIAVLDHRSIYGNQEPGGLTQRAVENILQLPAELQPKQVISSSAWADRPSRWPTTTTTSTWGTKSPLLVSLERQDGGLVCERCLLAETPLTVLGVSSDAPGSSGARDPPAPRLLHSHVVHALRNRRGVPRP